MMDAREAHNIANAIMEALGLRQEWMVRHESGG